MLLYHFPHKAPAEWGWDNKIALSKQRLWDRRRFVETAYKILSICKLKIPFIMVEKDQVPASSSRSSIGDGALAENFLGSIFSKFSHIHRSES